MLSGVLDMGPEDGQEEKWYVHIGQLPDLNPLPPWGIDEPQVHECGLLIQTYSTPRQESGTKMREVKFLNLNALKDARLYIYD